jgi:hypothetical protein
MNNQPFYVLLEGMTAIELLKLIHSDACDHPIDTTHITNHDGVYFQPINLQGDEIFIYAGLGWEVEFTDIGYEKLSKEKAIEIMYAS